MSELAYQVNIMKDGLVEISQDIDGKKSNKVTDLANFINIFQGVNTISETPMLPFGCRKIISMPKNDLVIIEVPQRVVPVINYEGREYQNVLIPRTLWFFYVLKRDNGKHLHKTYIYTLDALSPFSLDMPMYEWFLNNHNTHGFYGVCWGSNDKTRIEQGEYSGYTSLISMYFSSRFNNHLENGNINSRAFYDKATEANKKAHPSPGSHMERILVGLKDQTVFPYGLVPQTNKTPGRLITDFKTGNNT